MYIYSKPRFSTTALALGAALAVGLGAAALQPLVARAKAGGETYTFAFQRAMPQDVLRWMEVQGIAVQVNPADLPQKHLSFAFDGIERDELVKAFGTMIGLQAEKRGDVYSLLKGVGSDTANESLGSEGVCQSRGSGIIGGGWGMRDEERKQLEKKLQRLDHEIVVMPKVFDFDVEPMQKFFDIEPVQEFFDFEIEPVQEFFMIGQDHKALVEEIMKALEESGAFSGQKMNDDQKAALKARLTERLGRIHSGGMKMFDEQGRMRMFEEMQKSGKLYQLQGEGHKKAMEEMQKHMEEMRKSGFKGLTPEQIEKLKSEGMRVNSDEFQKHMEQMHKAIEEAHKSGFKGLTSEQIEKMKAEGMRINSDEFKRHMEEMRKHLGENMKVMQIKLENVKKFVASLTPAQRELADKQGFLRPEDLTKEQRELLGIGEDKGEVNMSFSVDGKNVVIKSGAKTAAKKTGISA
ncbi:MAG: hypothetical protein WD716_02465 [Fimbriimonadaceae bacterium]